jgi:ADP-heptose:LPS heptosyltransferase
MRVNDSSDLDNAAYLALAQEVLASCLCNCSIEHRALRRLVDERAGGVLFSVVAEGLSDSFEPALCDRYTDIFSRVIAMVRDDVDAAALAERHRCLTTRVVTSRPEGVFVLSRVTAGADVVITSVILNAVKARFPTTPIVLVGQSKIRDLFAADPRLQHLAIDYPRRGSVRARIACSYKLAEFVSKQDWIVIDPDSRLSQLGLVPICEPEAYYYFPSRTYASATNKSLTRLTREWVSECLGIANAMPYVAPDCHSIALRTPAVIVSFGVGGNDQKRMSELFEIGLVSGLIERGAVVYLDDGCEPEERARAARIAAIAGSDSVVLHHGSLGSFTALIQAGALYIGYDSFGQHVAAVSTVPYLSIFIGNTSSKFRARWSPTGCGPGYVLHIDGPSSSCVLQQVFVAVDKLGVLRVR